MVWQQGLRCHNKKEKERKRILEVLIKMYAKTVDEREYRERRKKPERNNRISLREVRRLKRGLYKNYKLICQ